MDDILLTPDDALKLVARRVRAARKARGWTQADLAARALVSVPTVARFERTGHGQLATLARICTALGQLHGFEALLPEPAPRTMAELRARERG